MREFLDDVYAHRDDGYGRAQKHIQRELPKRFYKDVDVARVEEGYTVILDGRPVKTPTKLPAVVPSLELAQAMAAEWAEQGEFIDPDLMPYVKLTNSALEGGDLARVSLIDEVVKFAANDLLLYRADSPIELVRKQEDHWDGALVKLAREFDITFEPTVGILHRAQPEKTIKTIREAIDNLDFITATAMVSITGMLGSGLLSIAIYKELLDRDQAWTAAHVDEDYQISIWGEDFEAADRRKRRHTEYEAAVNTIFWIKKWLSEN